MDWKHIATLSEKEQMRAWVENWQRIGPELERIKKEELRAMTEEEALSATEIVLDSEVDNYLPEWCKTSSGLIEQQRYFRKGRAVE